MPHGLMTLNVPSQHTRDSDPLLVQYWSNIEPAMAQSPVFAFVITSVIAGVDAAWLHASRITIYCSILISLVLVVDIRVLVITSTLAHFFQGAIRRTTAR